MLHWDWDETDRPPTAGRRWARSAECLATLQLLAFFLAFVQDGDTLAGASFRILGRISGGNELPWAAWALALAIVAPLAVWLDSGRLRVMVLVSQAVYLGVVAASFFAANRLGFGWAANGASCLWLLWRATTLIRGRPRRKGGKRRGSQQRAE